MAQPQHTFQRTIKGKPIIPPSEVASGAIPETRVHASNANSQLQSHREKKRVNTDSAFFINQLQLACCVGIDRNRNRVSSVVTINVEKADIY
jgi:hypothetical protein